MPEDGPRGLESDGTEATSATRVGAAEPASSSVPVLAPLSPDAAPPDRERRPYWAPWLIALLVFAVYTTISLFRYLQLDPSSWDLGIFTDLVKQYAHLRAPVADVRGAGVNLLGDHFSPIIALIAPFFLARPVPGHAARRAVLPDRGVRAPGDLGRGGQARAPRGRRRGRGVRVLLGPAADDQLRLPRDRVRGAAARVLAVRAGPGAPPGGGGLGPAPGLREGRPGLHGRRDRRPGDHPQPVAERPPCGPFLAASCSSCGGSSGRCWPSR